MFLSSRSGLGGLHVFQRKDHEGIVAQRDRLRPSRCPGREHEDGDVVVGDLSHDLVSRLGGDQLLVVAFLVPSTETIR